jgi:hypothetical protein
MMYNCKQRIIFHKNTMFYTLFPKSFGMPVDGETHSGSVHIVIFDKQVFEFLLECMIWVYHIE